MPYPLYTPYKLYIPYPFSIRICLYRCSMDGGPEAMCREKLNTHWTIYRVFTGTIYIL